MGKKIKGGRGPEAFFTHYQTVYGNRWPQIAASFTENRIWSRLDPIKPDAEPYFLDLGSVLVALALGVRPGMRVLDLCAAPGGKSLVLLRCLYPDDFPYSVPTEYPELADAFRPAEYRFQPSSGSELLVCNERSSQRRGRLRNNLEAHSLPHHRVTVTSHDAARWGMSEPESYDRVLADVPCSSERHLMENPKYLESWSTARTKHLAIQAGAIAISAFDSLVPGGTLVYSTCSISPAENEAVIEKLVQKRSAARITPAKHLPDWIEPRNPGYYILPDTAHGMGPLFFCVLSK